MNREEIVNELNVLMRKIKIDSLEKELPIYPNNISDKMFKTLQEVSKYGVITGSTVLKLYGLINRSQSDIDIVVDVPTLQHIKSKNKLSQSLYDIDINSHGFFMLNGYKIDIFSGDTKHIEYQGIKLDSVCNIINEKIKISQKYVRMKELNDFRDIIKSFKESYMGDSKKITPSENKSFFQKIVDKF